MSGWNWDQGNSVGSSYAAGNKPETAGLAMVRKTFPGHDDGLEKMVVTYRTRYMLAEPDL